MAPHFIKLLLLSTVVSFTTLAVPTVGHAETLSEALIAVYNKNPRLLAERARLREVDETYIQARAQGRFSITSSGQYSRTVTQAPATNPSADNKLFYGPYSGQIEIIQPIYQGGRVKALKAQAKAGILAQREALRAIENQLFLSGANAYVDVQLAEEAALIRRNNVKVLTRQLVAANERFNVGEGTRTDIAQSESRLAGAESGLAIAEASLQSARAVYRRIVGRIPTDLQPTPRFAVPVSVSDAIKKARENNPELIATYFSEEAGKAAINVAKAAGRPTLSLNGNVSAARGQLFPFEQSEQAAITAQVRIPIFSGGLNSSRVRQAKHAKTRLAFESRDTELAVDQAISQIWAQREAAQQTLLASQKQVSSAEVAFEGVSLEQQVGTRTQLDVLDAEQELLNAKLAVINAERDLNAATFQLLATIGVFDSEGIQLAIADPYDPNANFEAVRYDGLTELVDTTIAEPVQTLANGGAKAASGIVDGVGGVLQSPPVTTSVKLPAEAVVTIFSEGKKLTDKAFGQAPVMNPLAGKSDAEIDADPMGTDGLRDLPTLPELAETDSPQN